MHCLHVAGTIIIQQGTGGFYRGDMFEVILKYKSMLSFIVLPKVDMEVSPPILGWISFWSRYRGSEVELLTPKGRFERGHDVLGGCRNCDDLWLTGYIPGTIVRAPPPGRDRHALD